MRRKIIGIFVVGILIITGFASLPIHAGPAIEPLTSPDSQIIDMMQQVNESLLYYYISHLTAFGPRYTGTENCTKASQYIYDEFQTMGLVVEFHNWTFDEFTDRNVVATFPGTDPSSNAVYIICAHHDTVSEGPGAEDDGSGVAAVLATAKILSQYSFMYTIRFITVSGEEVGLYGSYIYARDAYQRGDNIVAVIDLDQIGYANTTASGQILPLLVPQRSMWIGDFVQTVNTLYRNQTNMTAVAFQIDGASDYRSFVEYGFDAVMGIDVDWPPPGYHTQNDTLDRVNWTYLTKTTKLILAVMAEFASTPIELQVIITRPYEGYLYFSNIPRLSLDFWKNWKYNLRGTTFIFGRATVNVEVIPNNDITDVIFCIDNWPQDTQSGTAPYYEWTIKWRDIFFLPSVVSGRHNIEVYTSSTSGTVASDEMDIVIFTI